MQSFIKSFLKSINKSFNRSFNKSFVFALITLVGLGAHAWVSTAPVEKEFSFKFQMKNEKYEYSQKAGSYEEAFEKAAQSCYRHFKGGRQISEDRGLDIIDVCANPRTI